MTRIIAALTLAALTVAPLAAQEDSKGDERAALLACLGLTFAKMELALELLQTADLSVDTLWMASSLPVASSRQQVLRDRREQRQVLQALRETIADMEETLVIPCTVDVEEEK